MPCPFEYEHCDVPEGQTLTAYRIERCPTRRSAWRRFCSWCVTNITQ